MTPFWASFFEHVRGCGRHAVLFAVALPVFLILIGVGASLDAAFPQCRVPALYVIGFCAFLWLCAAAHRARTRRRHRLGSEPLSENEWRIARSRLRRRRR